jgi:hypothetical protein
LRNAGRSGRSVASKEAKTAAADEPDTYEEVWRNGRFFVGLRVDLAEVTHERMRELVEHAWRNRAPKRLIAEYDSRPADGPATGPALG